MVEAQPGPSSVLLSSCLGRTFSLPDARLSVTSTTSLNHLSSPNDASPAFLHLNIREMSFLETGRLDGKRACKSQNHEQRKSKKEFRQRCKRRRRSGGVVSYANQRATCSWLWPFHSKPLSAAPTVPCAAAAIPGCCMIPPAIPIISGYFIISGCSHNSDINGRCALALQL